ncbi:uncharacterized protein [Coffea arabica]|uniref:Uncharacterized protein isoform X1 n=1 Tax=Coffea arabica TaxID=13443 RepID=A0ABM4X1Y9_COFAR
MREGLRSNARQKGEREMLDLNKEPSENKMPSSASPSSTDYFSAQEDGRDVDSSVNMKVADNADADDVGQGEGGEGKEENNLKSNGGEYSEDAVGKAEFHFPSTNAGLVTEQVSESEPLACRTNAADIGVVNVGVSGGASISGEVVGKKRRGRKRKVAGSGLSGDGGAELESLKVESAKLAKIGEDGSTHEVLEDGRDADMVGDVVADPSTGESRQETSKGRRGRKRKTNPSGDGVSEDGGKKVEKLAVEARPQILGRVLRSRTIASTGSVKQAQGEGNAGDHEGQLDIIKTKVEADESVRPAWRGRKTVKGRRGRPPKVHGKSGNLKVAAGQKTKAGSERNFNLRRAKVVKVKKHKEKVKSDMPKLQEQKSNHKNESEVGRNTEKQLLRNRIISILKEAGWTIQYRPRMSKEYCDAVYVDHQGRTYWSVTLAYKKLKEMVENGTADAKAISAFTLIPEDELSKLYRITKEKGSKCKKLPKVGGSKTGKGHDSTALSMCKGNSNANPYLGEKPSRKKKVDISEQGNQVIFSGRRKSKSRKKGERKPCTLLARCPENDHDADGFEMYKGKRTLLSWMIDWGTVSPGVKVQCMNHERTASLLEGRITSEGISCDCCGKVVTCADFKSHAGSSLGQAYENIFLESGHSLLQCIRESWSKQEKTDNIGFHQVNVDVAAGDDPHDDTCNICADGGELTCCDGCSSTFHHRCLQMEHEPVGYWRCVYCSCKFCGMAFSAEFCEKISEKASLSDDAPGTENAPGPDDTPYMDDAPGTDDATDTEENPDKKKVDPVLIDYMDDYERFRCYFCEEIFHTHCRSGKDAVDNHAADFSFCGRGCQKLYENLQKLLGVRHELEAGYSWTVLRRQDVVTDVVGNADSLEVLCNSKLAIALSLMDECFEPIIDERSNINVIQSVIYSCGSNLRRLNFQWFYTFILERGDELVSAAAVRLVHGNQVAEMPFIGTRFTYRRQGMCRRLLTAIELALSSLNVEKLVIPAVAEVRETWTKAFGFIPLEESKRQEMKYMSMVAFPGTDMLQKPICMEGTTSTMGGEVSKPTIEFVNGATTPCNLDASTADKLEENVETVAAVGSGGLKHNTIVLVA